MYKHETPLAFDRTTNKMLLQPGAQTATKGEGTVEGGGRGGEEGARGTDRMNGKKDPLPLHFSPI